MHSKSSTKAHKYALMLSPENAYFRATHSYSQDPSKNCWSKGKFKKVFGISKATAENRAKMMAECNDDSNAEKMEESTRKFRESLDTENHELLSLNPIKMDDLKKGVGEKSVIDFAKKLGFVKRNKSDSKFIFEKGNFIFDRETMWVAVDREKNIKNKVSCNVNIRKEDADSIIRLYQGVYGVLYPFCFPGEKTFRFVVASMRIVHSLYMGGYSNVRVKLNLPNMLIDDYRARFQYRGYLKPTNDLRSWTIQLNLGGETCDQEELIMQEPEFMLDQTINPNEDDVELRLDGPVGSGEAFGGLISSLSQRPYLSAQKDTRVSYSSQTAVAKVYDGGDENGRNFMQKEIAIYNSLDEVRNKNIAGLNHCCDHMDHILSVLPMPVNIAIPVKK